MCESRPRSFAPARRFGNWVRLTRESPGIRRASRTRVASMLETATPSKTRPDTQPDIRQYYWDEKRQTDKHQQKRVCAKCLGEHIRKPTTVYDKSGKRQLSARMRHCSAQHGRPSKHTPLFCHAEANEPS